MKWFSSLSPGGKQKWQREREREKDLRVMVTHLSGSCHQTSMCSPLLLLGRGPSPPSLPSCFASSHPGKGQHFGSASLSSQKGSGEKDLANPICPSSLVNCAQEKTVQPVRANSKRRHDKMTTSQPWNSRNVYEMEGALMGWPQTRRCVHCWNYHWTKHSDGDLSHHTALLSAYTGRRCMVTITPAHYGWMRSFTEGGDDPIINFSNKTPFSNLGLPTLSSSLTHSFVFHRHPKSPITEAWVA